MHRAARTLAAAGCAAVLAAVVLAFWPLHANGVSGSAVLPRYAKYFGFTTTQALPVHPTDADLRRAGVRLPRNVVSDQRHLTGTVATAGLAAIAVGVALGRVTRRAG